MIPQSFIDDLLNRLDVVDVVGRAVTLKKAGANYQACCPFHQEKTPSFTVSPVKQFYHCFGCGAHGNGIDFVMAWRGLSFVQAINELAHMAGMVVPKDESQPVQRQPDQLTPVLEEASRFYRLSLKGSKRAIDYLKTRGLTGLTAARFGLGYAPAGWRSLETALKNYEADEVVDSGLVIVSETGRRYDRFRDRIMFPIVGFRGRIVGFGGRVLDTGEPKYMNSPETRLFEKGKELYGLAQAQKAIRIKGRVLVVEGYMDVVMLHQYGVDYAVATLGTATTEAHAKSLMRLADEIVFSFDGDSAGRRAAWKALNSCLKVIQDGKKVKFLFLPEGDDPDSYVRGHGKQAFERLVEDAQSLAKFLLEHLASGSDLQTEEGQARLIKEAYPLIHQMPAPAYRLVLRKSLAQRVGLSLEELDEFSGKVDQKPVFSGVVKRGGSRLARVAPSLLRHLIKLVFMQPSLALNLRNEAFTGKGADLLQHMIEMVVSSQDISSIELQQELLHSEFSEITSIFLSEISELNGKIDVQQEFMDAVGKWRERQRKRRVDELLKNELTPAGKEELRGLLAH
ncbi:MAG: DNA primase [Proteobacteria bacterium]|nr:DNA primase [Pseudomonadota bacterium]MDE3207923.1 DNA primase [Pseudomonadota bacterium]